MTQNEKDLCNAIARAIGELVAIERAAGGGDPLGPLRDIRVRAQYAQRHLVAALGAVPKSTLATEAIPDLATLARNAGAV